MPPSSRSWTPLAGLSRDQLSVFLFVALTPEETRAIVKERKLSIPGFRTGSLGDVERCDVIADEIRANPPAARSVLDALTKAFERPPFPRHRARESRTPTTCSTSGAGTPRSPFRSGGCSPTAAPRSAPRRCRSSTSWRPTTSVPARRAPALRPVTAGTADDPAAQVVALVGGARPARDAAPGGRAGRARPAPRRSASGARSSGRSSRARCARPVRGSPGRSRSRRGPRMPRPTPGRRRPARAARRMRCARPTRRRTPTGRAPSSATWGASSGRWRRASSARREREQELEPELDRARVERAPRPAPEPGPAAPEEAEGSDPETWLMPVYTREFYDSHRGLGPADPAGRLQAGPPARAGPPPPQPARHPAGGAAGLLPGAGGHRRPAHLPARRAAEHRGDPLAHRPRGPRPVRAAGEDARV